MVKIRIIIAGSRDFNNYNLLREESLRVIQELKDKGYNTEISNIEIISGTANGADKLGERFAKEFNIRCVRFPAKWNEYGKRAGYLRNNEMSSYAKKDDEIGVLIAFWNGSKGTEHMINLATKDNLDVNIIRF